MGATPAAKACRGHGDMCLASNEILSSSAKLTTPGLGGGRDTTPRGFSFPDEHGLVKPETRVVGAQPPMELGSLTGSWDGIDPSGVGKDSRGIDE